MAPAEASVELIDPPGNRRGFRSAKSRGEIEARLLQLPLRREAPGMLNPRRFSFGGTSAIVTSMGVIIGLGAASAELATVVSGLLIVAFADNLSDSLSIHMYQEAEKLEGRTAFRSTLTNFMTRILVALSFVAIVLMLPAPYAAMVALGWGCALLAAISCMLARSRSVGAAPEVVKHLGMAVLVIGASRVIGLWIMHHVH